MKKLLVLPIIIFLVFSTGCPDKSDNSPKNSENKTQVMKIDPKSAKSFMENYMGYVLKRDTGAMKSFYSPELKDKIRDIPVQSNPHPVGFKLGEGESKEKNVEFKVHIYNAFTGSPYYSDDSLKYTVTMNNGKMYIDKIEKDKTTVEVYSKGGTLYKKEGDKVIGDYIVSLQDLPDYGIPRYTSSPEQKFPIPKQSFGPCAISPDGKSIVITSTEKHSFLALVEGGGGKEQGKGTEKETMNMQPGEKKQGGGGKEQAGGGEESQQGQQTQESPSEKELERVKNQTVKPIDFLLDTKVNLITFSPNGKMFAVEYLPQGKLTNILVYKGEGGDVIETKINKQFRPDRFSITNPYFSSEDKLVFTVEPVRDATKEEQSQGGTWNYDMKEEKLSKIK